MNNVISLSGDFTRNCLIGDCSAWNYTATINIKQPSRKGASFSLELTNLTLNAPDLTTWSWGEQ
jgi:hypothetical protein